MLLSHIVLNFLGSMMKNMNGGTSIINGQAIKAIWMSLVIAYLPYNTMYY